MKKQAWLAAALVVGVSWTVSQVSAQQKDAAPAKKEAKETAKDAKAGADMAAEMAEFVKKSQPGPEHAALKPLIGDWTCDVNFWATPEAPVDKSSGTVKRTWILGGRYMEETFQGTAMGMPFEGQGLLAYDKNQGHYESTWIDSLNTGIHRQQGKADAGGKSFTFEGENFCPMMNKIKWTKSTVEINSNDKNTLRMFEKGPDGKEWKSFEMVCTRK